MPFPDRWNPFFATLMTPNDVYAYPTQHYDFDAKPGSFPPTQHIKGS